MSKILSVVIPAYNCEKTLEKAVNSVLEQPCAEDIEIILVDDGAKDSTPQLCDNLAEKYSNNIKVFHRKNSGAALSRNFGIDHATGKYIAFLDSDDWWNKDIIDNSLCETLKKEDIDIFAFPINYVSYNYKHQKVKKPPANPKEIIGFGKQIYPNIMHPTALYKTSLLNNNKIRYPNISVMEDGVFVVMAFSIASTYKFIDKVFYNYQLNLNSFFHNADDTDIFYAVIQGSHCINQWGEENGNDVRISDRGMLSDIVKFLPRYCATHSYDETVKFFSDPIFNVMNDPKVKPWSAFQKSYDLWNKDKKKFWRNAKLKMYIPCKLKESRTKPPFIKLKNYVWYRIIKKIY